MKIMSVLLLSAILANLVNCTLNFVKDDTLKSLQGKYEGVYVCTSDISAGSSETIQAGTKVRLYLQSGSNSLKVYAYPQDAQREQALGKNILYLFDTDFPDNKFAEIILEKKLEKLVKKTG